MASHYCPGEGAGLALSWVENELLLGGNLSGRFAMLNTAMWNAKKKRSMSVFVITRCST